MTFIAYPNLTATSASGEFRVEICGSPGDYFFRDQGHFKYRLFQSDSLVWEWPAGDGRSEYLDDYPHGVWVHDQGWIVVRTHEWFRAGLMLFSPTGEVVFRQNLQRLVEGEPPGFLDDAPEEFLGGSSAGPFWARCSLAYFFEQEGRPCWAIRTWWGRRVVLELQSAVLIESAQLNEADMQARDRDCVRRLASSSVEDLVAWTSLLPDEKYERANWPITTRIISAAYHAGWLQDLDAIPMLRHLERQGEIGSTRSLSWATVSSLPFRHVAKTSLLRLGQVPHWQAHYQFELHPKLLPGERAQKLLFEFPQQVNDRRPDYLVSGLTQPETLLRLGAPDFIRDVWEYDFFGPEASCTARVFWDASRLAAPEQLPRISHVEILAPQWQQLTLRDHYLTSWD